MKKSKILALAVLVLGTIYLLISLSLVIDKTLIRKNNTIESETSNQQSSTSPDIDGPSNCKHEFSAEWIAENGQHFHKCTLADCNYTDTKISCSGGNATCTQKAICQFCSSPYGDIAEHIWNTSWDYSNDAGHAHNCLHACNTHSEIQPHVPGPEATETSPQVCVECGFVIIPSKNHMHTIEKISFKNASCTEYGNIEHFVCTECSKLFYDSLATQEILDSNSVKSAPLGHDFSDASCTDARRCQHEGCNATDGLPLGHTPKDDLYSNADIHWHECSVCSVPIDQAPHAPGPEATENSPQYCLDCRYIIVPTKNHVHSIIEIAAKDPTCTTSGNIAYFKCSGCSKCFLDISATKEITGSSSISIAQLGHDYSAATCTTPKTCKRSGCGNTVGQALGHTPSNNWSIDSQYHWHQCSACGDRADKSAHTPGAPATEQSPQTCTQCNYVLVPKLNHVHTVVKIKAQDATCTNPGNIEYYVCSGCSEYFFDISANNKITNTGSIFTQALGHDFAPATCTEPKTCKRNNCNTTQGTAIGHKQSVNWISNSSHHWKLCSVCGDDLKKASHTPGTSATEHSPQVCIECNYILVPKLNHTHTITRIPAQNPTCTKEGNIEHYVCSGCSDYFSDASANNKITNAESLLIPALGHNFSPATCTDPKKCKRDNCNTTEGNPLGHRPNGNWNSNPSTHWKLCSVCGTHLNASSHTPGPAATEQSAQSCTQCGYVIAQKLEHTHKYGTSPKYDPDNHWYECSCGHIGNKQAHADSNKDSKCDTCKYNLPPVTSEGENLEDILGPAQITLLRPVASGVLTKSNSSAIIDYSNYADGYVMVKYIVDTTVRLKVQVQGPSTTYTYNISPHEWNVFPLSDGNGAYTIKVFKNTSGNRYSVALSLMFDAKLSDEFAPFLRPNQYVNYENAVNSMNKAAEIVAGKSDTLDKVAAIYNYIIRNISYDYEKAETIQSGYLPDLDQVLAEKKGICFDYAALMAGMLRSQNIACKLVVGYADTAYHAWISVWTPDKGWIDGAIFFDGVKWQLMDPTYASALGSSIINKVNYTSKYIY